MASCGTNTTCFSELTFPVSKTVWKTTSGSEHLCIILNVLSLQDQPLSYTSAAAVAVRTERRGWKEGAWFIKHNPTAKPPKQDAPRTAALSSPRLHSTGVGDPDSGFPDIFLSLLT